MNITIQPGRAVGTVAAPPSKSMAHRLLICAALARGESHIRGIGRSEDILATLDCLRTLGAKCTVAGDTVTVMGTEGFAPSGDLCCRESGSTLRFLIPLALLGGNLVSFTGSGRLFRRPLEVYRPFCRVFSPEENRLQVQGALTGGTYRIPGDVSSQFISGLLFALPLAKKDSRIILTTPIESKHYIDLTLQALAGFGVKAQWCDRSSLFIAGRQQYLPGDFTVEGDYSGAAFFGALNALGSDITVTGLDPDSLQGDKVYGAYLQQLCTGTPTLDLSHCPDLAPVLFAVAAAKQGAVFTGTGRLKLKESDRAAAMAQELSAFGAKVLVEENSVTVLPEAFHGPDRVLSGHNDHRIVMALAVLLTLTGGEIAGAQAVSKSFPDFFEALAGLGIAIS